MHIPEENTTPNPRPINGKEISIRPYIPHHEIKPLETASSSITRQDGQEQQFINLTDSISLDPSSRIKVRVHAMRDFHRRRLQGSGSKVTESSSDERKAKDVKAQMGRFRLVESKQGGMKSVPSKSQERQKPDNYIPNTRRSRKKSLAGSRSRRKHVDRIGDSAASQANDPSLLVSAGSSAPELDGNIPDFVDHPSDVRSIAKWLGSLNLSLEDAALYQSPGSGRLDPFSAMSLLITPHIQVLLHYYFGTRLYSSWLMMPLRRAFFSLSVHDEAVFHTFLSQYAASYNLRFRSGDPIECVHHRTKAMQIVNQRLDGSQSLSDGTIAAVANMAIYEVNKIHSIDYKAGLLTFYLAVRKWFAGQTDLNVANVLSRKPRFPPLNIPLTTTPDGSLPRSDWPTVCHSEQPPDRIDGKDRFGLILSDLQDLSNRLQLIRNNPADAKENIWYSDKTYYVQRCLVDLSHCSDIRTRYIDIACAFAGICFSYSCFQDISFKSRIIGNFVSRLKNAIDKAVEKESDFLPASRLLWALVLGGMAAEEKDERGWFVEKFKKICEVMELANWESVKARLEGILWSPELNEPVSRFWEEVRTV
ncbi:hypothetical protein B7494_g3981 [Chlorociboria aeruginascens]|nr:hypothetical protein B7494_g3981 [Chlorociboria aeruginascens]